MFFYPRGVAREVIFLLLTFDGIFLEGGRPRKKHTNKIMQQ